MSYRRTSALVFPALLAAVLPVRASAQGYTLHPGDLVIADTSQSSWPSYGRVLVLHEDGHLETIASGAPLDGPTDVYVDRDGAVLVSSYAYQAASANGIYRLDPATGAVAKLNHDVLEDNFQLCRDGRGDLVVADGYRGLRRLLPDGSLVDLSPPTSGFDPSIGLTLAQDHALLATQAPNYLWGSTAPGYVHRVDPVTGARTVLAENRQLLPNPNGLALHPAGFLLVTDALSSGGQVRHGLVGVRPSGAMARLNWDGLVYPTDVEFAAPALAIIADPGREAVLLRLPDGTLRTVVSEADDGDPFNGLPVDRPFGLAKVPTLWLRTPLEVAVGAAFQVRISAPRALGGTPLVLAVGLEPGPSPLSAWWPGDRRFAWLDLGRARLYRAVLDGAGQATVSLTVPNDPRLAGRALQLQAFHPGEHLVGNHVALPVR